MSDRRPSKRRALQAATVWWNQVGMNLSIVELYEAVTDPVAVVRRGVESGTIKPDYEAAKEGLRDTPGVTLLLSRILELAGMPMERVMEKDLGGFARMLEDHVLRSRKVREAVDAALGIGPVSDGGSET